MTIERSTTVMVSEGLHARPATRFVKLAKSFAADVEIAKGEKAVSAKSAVKLMLLAVGEGDEVTLRVSGPDEGEAMAMLLAYLANPKSGHGEEDAQDPATPVASEKPSSDGAGGDGAIRGVAASPGTALGPVFAFFPAVPEPAAHDLPEAERPAEAARLRQAAEAVAARITDAAGAGGKGGDAAIMTALGDLATDEEFLAEAERLVGRGLDAVSATLAAANELSRQFEGLDDPYLRARGEDVDAVARQICMELAGIEESTLADLPDGAVLVAEDLGAYDLARADMGRIAGIVCARGGTTSHIAIMARNHAIPAVLGLGEAVQSVAGARLAGLDGRRGEVFADPDEAQTSQLHARIAAEDAERAALTAYVDHRPVTADGQEIEVAANLGSLDEIDKAKAAGAMGVGLFRTELMYMAEATVPDEEAQFAVYRRLAEAFAPDPVIVRTLDIGGDKPVAGIDLPVEDNPFLGWRGIRMCLDRPAVFKPQLRALLRAAVAGNVKIMFPMVATREELRRARALVAECAAELEREGAAFALPPVGIMIETPAAVFDAEALARDADFFSIGTNDLTQYVMAADRLNASVAALNDVRQPAVMAAIEMTARAGRAAGIMVGMCGEAASDPELVPCFLDMGITEFSMSPNAIAAVKKAVADREAARG